MPDLGRFSSRESDALMWNKFVGYAICGGGMGHFCVLRAMGKGRGGMRYEIGRETCAYGDNNYKTVAVWSGLPADFGSVGTIGI